jgi:subtilisin-like proprotein convertase family protein
VTLKTRKARFTLCVAVASVLGAVFSSSAQGAFAFSNGATITIPAGAPGDDGPGNANPYPSSINVSGLLGTVGKATVTLTNLTHTWPDDIDILLSGPGGQAVILMSDAGTSLDVNNVTLTFDDAAGSSLPNEAQIVSGTFTPSNYIGNDTLGVDTFTPGPAPSGSTLGVFTGTDPNGTWNLWVVDDEDQDVGALSGWTLSLDGPTLAPGTPPPPPPPPANPAPVPTSPTPCSSTQRGTGGHDVLIGTSGGDRLVGLGGPDVLRGRAGEDCLYGGRGNDLLVGGPAHDVLRCGRGRNDRAVVRANDSVSGCEHVRRG